MEWLNEYQGLANSVVSTFAVIAGVVAFTRFLNRQLERKILEEVQSATKEIQPDANGGQSLADLHMKVDAMCKQLSIVKKAVGHLENEMEKLEEDVEELK